MNKRNLIYTGLLMLAMVTSPVSAKETSVSVVHGTANFNEGNASIVIQANQNQSMQGKSFKVYKLFDATNSKDNTSIHYTLNSVYASKIKELVSSKLSKTVSDQDVVEYMMSLDNEGSQSEYRTFIESIQKAISSMEARIVNVESCDVNGNITLDKLGYGFYLIDEITNVSNSHAASSMTMVNTANPKATIQIKSDYPSIVKKIYEDDNNIGWNDMGDFEIMQDISYKYESKVPDMSGYASYFLEFEDEMDPSLSLKEDSIQVKVKDTIIPADTYSVNKSSTGFKVTFHDFKGLGSQGDPILFTYDAYLNDLAATKISKKGFENKVRLNFSNDPQTNSKGQTPWDSVVCYTYQVRGLKTNEKDVKLEGATFKLYRDSNLSDLVKVKKSTNGYVVSNSVDEEIVSNEKGEFVIQGLDQGTYYLKEIKAPDGYTLLKEAIEIQITPTFVADRNNYTSNGEGLVSLSATSFNTHLNASTNDLSVALKVVNQTGSKLPITGSMGTIVCVLTGAGIMVYVCKKKREELDSILSGFLDLCIATHLKFLLSSKCRECHFKFLFRRRKNG